MGVARPVRVLGALSIGLFFYLVFQLLRSPTPLDAPGGNDGGKIDDMTRDPLLDRE